MNQALKGVAQDHNVALLEELQATTRDDVLDVLREYFLPLFDAETSVATVVTGTGTTDEIAKSLGELGFDVKQRTLEIDAEVLEDGDSGSESGSDSGSER